MGRRRERHALRPGGGGHCLDHTEGLFRLSGLIAGPELEGVTGRLGNDADLIHRYAGTEIEQQTDPWLLALKGGTVGLGMPTCSGIAIGNRTGQLLVLAAITFGVECRDAGDGEELGSWLSPAPGCGRGLGSGLVIGGADDPR